MSGPPPSTTPHLVRLNRDSLKNAVQQQQQPSESFDLNSVQSSIEPPSSPGDDVTSYNVAEHQSRPNCHHHHRHRSDPRNPSSRGTDNPAFELSENVPKFEVRRGDRRGSIGAERLGRDGAAREMESAKRASRSGSADNAAKNGAVSSRPQNRISIRSSNNNLSCNSDGRNIADRGARNEPDRAEKKKKKQQQKDSIVPLRKFYQFADKTDAALMTIGGVASVANGATFPLFLTIFGSMNGIVATNGAKCDVDGGQCEDSGVARQGMGQQV